MKNLLASLTLVFLCASTPAKAWDAKKFKMPTQDELKKKLTPLQYDVTQNEGTEQPYKNDYFDNHKEGIYVDIVSGEPLFSSTDKFESGTGWPSFFRPLVAENVTTKKDTKLLMERNEVRSKYANSHLGHLFSDGPQPTGFRYCMDSAAMRFIPAAQLEKEGYPEYVKLFKNDAVTPAASATPAPVKKKT